MTRLASLLCAVGLGVGALSAQKNVVETDARLRSARQARTEIDTAHSARVKPFVDEIEALRRQPESAARDLRLQIANVRIDLANKGYLEELAVFYHNFGLEREQQADKQAASLKQRDEDLKKNSDRLKGQIDNLLATELACRQMIRKQSCEISPDLAATIESLTRSVAETEFRQESVRLASDKAVGGLRAQSAVAVIKSVEASALSYVAGLNAVLGMEAVDIAETLLQLEQTRPIVDEILRDSPAGLRYLQSPPAKRGSLVVRMEAK